MNDKDSQPFTEDELIYAAFARCKCGAGLAYFKSESLDPMERSSAWYCYALMKGEKLGELTFSHVIFKEDPPADSYQHDAYPFMCWSIKSEQQPSAQGQTTRPKK